jgi:L-lactate dehydrogenase complex protein LldG
MNTRAFVLDSVRRNQPAGMALPELPPFPHPGQDLWGDFSAALARMGGTIAALPPQTSLRSLIIQRFPHAHVICSATPEVQGTRSLQAVGDPRELRDVDVGVVRAAFGVAETGSVWLSEREFGLNALGFLSQHLVVLLDPAAIAGNLHDAYQDAGFLQARYAVLMTGPSATADIEGVLVRGAQGIRSLTVIPIARQAPVQPA